MFVLLGETRFGGAECFFLLNFCLFLEELALVAFLVGFLMELNEESDAGGLESGL